MRFFGFLAAALLASACGESPLTQPPVDMADAAKAPVDMAPPAPDLPPPLPKRDPENHPELPQVDYLNGPTLAAPEVTTIVWKGDEALGADVQKFMSWMLQSDDYWVTSLGEYGVGKGTAEPLVVLPDAPPTTVDDADIGPMIRKYLGTGLFPAPNKNTIYSFIIPFKTKSTMFGSNGCADYGGYHSETRSANAGGISVSYMINLQCYQEGIDALTEVISHEAAEAATDPYPFTAPGYLNQTVPIGGEIGDLCVGLNQVYSPPGSDTISYSVTRLYSKMIATSGDADPCVPAPTDIPYFNVGIEPRDIEITLGDDTVTYEAQIQPYAFGNVGTIRWDAQPYFGPGITMTPKQGSGQAGDTIRLEISVKASAHPGTYPLILGTRSQKGGQNMWLGSLTID